MYSLIFWLQLCEKNPTSQELFCRVDALLKASLVTIIGLDLRQYASKQGLTRVRFCSFQLKFVQRLFF